MLKINSKFFLVFFFFFFALFIIIFLNIPYKVLKVIQNGMYITESELNNIKNSNNAFISSEFKNVFAYDEEKDKKVKNLEVKFKLFNLFNIKNLKVKVVDNVNVLLGGDSVGFSLNSKGVTIVGSNFVLTKNGAENPINSSDLKVGDTILEINNIEILSAEDVNNAIKNLDDKEVTIKYKRNNKEFLTTIKPALDIQTKTYKLGIWVKDNTMGVGTLTYIKEDDLRFGSLGHAVADGGNGNDFEVQNGEVYKCNVIGVKKGTRGEAGEILGLFLPGKNVQGDVDKNNNFGLYGNMFENSEFLENKQKIEIGGRASCKPGKAQILTCISGTKVNVYDIEIIKTNYQNTANEKSMVIKVTDKKLLEETGGIVQGMSGSPIIQDGKIVGAVTHVFVSDPTKGFGLYIDWMLDN